MAKAGEKKLLDKANVEKGGGAMKRLATYVLYFLIFFTSLSEAAIIKGKVYRWPDLKVLSGATVTYDSYGGVVKSNEEGLFQITVSEGVYDLRVTLEGYLPARIPLHLTSVVRYEHSVDVILIEKSLWEGILSEFGFSFDPSKGYVLLLNVRPGGLLSGFTAYDVSKTVFLRAEDLTVAKGFQVPVGYDGSGLFIGRDFTSKAGVLGINFSSDTYLVKPRDGYTELQVIRVAPGEITEVVSCEFGFCEDEVISQAFIFKGLPDNTSVISGVVVVPFSGVFTTDDEGRIYFEGSYGASGILSVNTEGYVATASEFRFDGIDKAYGVISRDYYEALKRVLNLTGEEFLTIGLVRHGGNSLEGVTIKVPSGYRVYYLNPTEDDPIRFGSTATSSSGLFCVVGPRGSVLISAIKDGYRIGSVYSSSIEGSISYVELRAISSADWRFYVDVLTDLSVKIVSDPPGIDCTGSCRGYFTAGTEVKIEVRGSDVKVESWDGCDEVRDEACYLKVGYDRVVKLRAKLTEATGGSGGKVSEGHVKCFIASAVYGEGSWEVQVLRRFRDEVLMRSAFGRVIIGFYYEYSPKVADYIKERRFLARCLGILMEPLVIAIAYPITSLSVVLLIVVVLLTGWYFKRESIKC